MDAVSFSINDLLGKGAFRKWVKEPTPELNSFWKTWQGNDPTRAQLMGQARLIILSIDFKKSRYQDIDVQIIFKRMVQSIQKGEEQANLKLLEKKETTHG